MGSSAAPGFYNPWDTRELVAPAANLAQAQAADLLQRALAPAASLPEVNRNIAAAMANGYPGVPRNASVAAFFYEKAAAAGDLAAKCRLARILIHGDADVPPDRPRALRLLEDVAGDPARFNTVRFEIAALLSIGFPDVPLDTPRAAAIFEDMIEEEAHAEAMFSLAVILSEGRGQVRRDRVRALSLYERAAQQDHLMSMFNLALLLGTENEGIQMDKHRAISLLETAAERGCMQAYHYLGVILAGFDNDPPLDINRGIQILELCIEQFNHIGAMTDLSVIFGEGRHGIKQDVPRAIQLLERAIAVAFEYDRVKLAELGISVMEDAVHSHDADAEREREALVSSGSHLIAMLNLAELLLGDIGPRDVDKAVTLCRQALKDERIKIACRDTQMDDLLQCTQRIGRDSGGDGRNGAKAVEICQLISDATEYVSSTTCVEALRIHARLLSIGAPGVECDMDKAVSLYGRAVDLGRSTRPLVSAVA